LDQSGNKGRSDDCASLREDAIGYIRQVKGIPGVEDVPELDRKAKKDTRGFNHHATARLLCPREIRDEFDKDREKFCRDVQNGTRSITHKDWPSFLYPENGYNPEVIDEGLLRGPFLVSVSFSVICLHIANLSVVLPTHLHWRAHRPEGNPGQGTRKKMHC
jgi:hypothetical protein